MSTFDHRDKEWLTFLKETAKRNRKLRTYRRLNRVLKQIEIRES